MFTMHVTSTVRTSLQILSRLQFSECFKSKQTAEDHPLRGKRKTTHSGDPGDTFQAPSEEHLWFHCRSSPDFPSSDFHIHSFSVCVSVFASCLNRYCDEAESIQALSYWVVRQAWEVKTEISKYVNL